MDFGLAKNIIDSISSAIEAVKKAYDAGAHIWDDQKQRTFRRALGDLATTMTRANTVKIQFRDALQEYLSNQKASDRSAIWPEIKNRLPEVAGALKEVTNQLDRDLPKFLRAAGIVDSAALGAGLAAQKQQYERLDELSEPKTPEEIEQLQHVHVRLTELLANVTQLESTLDQVIAK